MKRERTERLYVRVTPEDKEKAKKNAKQAKLELSEYIRERVCK